MSNNQERTNIATIKDVARLAKASISTVSRVINNKGGVSPDLEDRIKQAINSLKYKPNTLARALKSKATKSLGLIVPSIENAIFPQLIKVIEESAKRYGFSTILCNSHGSVEEEGSLLQLLVEKQVDGIIFNPMGTYDPKFDIVKENQTPIIVLGKKIDGFDTTNINANNSYGAYLATSHLIKTGMKAIAFLSGELEASSAISCRFEGYRAALEEHGLSFKEELVVKGSGSFEGGINAAFDGGIHGAEELIGRGVRFDSVFASNDMTALGCLEKLIEAGYKIPDDISIIGYDDIPVSRIVRPHLSTVHSPIREFGIEAVKTILRIIYSKKDSYHEKMFEPELILRSSTKPLANE